jgi:eukaryotic-like serine/threonine-protein kinase
MRDVDPPEHARSTSPAPPDPPIATSPCGKPDALSSLSSLLTPGVAANTDELLAAARLDQRARWLRADRLPAEAYLDRFPQLQADDIALVLIYGEYLLRAELGQEPNLDEFGVRFPQHAERLVEQDRLHRLLDPDTVAAPPPAGASRASIESLPTSGSEAALPAVPGYEILGELGRGGMGVVYKARQIGLNRVVALKMILTGSHAGPAHLARFRAEGEAVARLQHPNIVQVYDVGEQDGRPYFSLEFVNGGTLAQRLNGTPQPPHAAARLIHTLALAIHTAHQSGIIHRDLKPANILFQESAIKDGNGDDNRSNQGATGDAALRVPSGPLVTEAIAKITDFGLAKQLDVDRGQTGSSIIVGTPSYMAPEQAEGKQHQIGPAADVYALGAILYELLAGRPPFRAEAPLDTLRLVLSEEPVSLSRLHPKVPRDLETICLKCLQKEPEKRYATAAALAEDLRRFQAGEPIVARPIGVLGRTWRWCRRNPRWAAMLATVAGLLLLIAVGASVLSLGLSAALGRARDAEQDAEKKLFESLVAQARATRLSGRSGQRFDSLKTLEEAVRIARSLDPLDTHALELRNEAIACLALADLRVIHKWEIPTPWDVPQDFPVAFDAGLERYACSDQQGTILVRQVADHREIARLPGPGVKVSWVNLCLTPDSRFLAAGYWLEDRKLQFVLWQLAGGEMPRKVFQAEDAAVCAFSANGRWLAVSRTDGSILLRDLVQGRQKSLGPGLLHSLHLAFHPDGLRLACNGLLRRHEIQVLDTETNQVIKRLPHPDDLTDLAWSADGRLLAAGCDDRNVYVWDTADWRQQAVLEGHQKQAFRLAFSPVGELLATASWDGTTRLWDPVSGRQLVTTAGTCSQFSGDGRRLAFRRDSRMGLWEVADGRECRVLHHGRVGNRTPWLFYKGPETVDFSHPDGRLLVSAAGDGVRLWDVASRTEIAYLNIGHHEAAVFHPDGTRLYTCGRTGLRCWPVRSEPRGVAAGLRVGPAQLLDVPAVQGWFRGSCCQDGRLLAVSDHLTDDRDRAYVFPADHPTERVLLQDFPKIDLFALSHPDGRWVAASVVGDGGGVKIWDARTGRVVQHLSTDNNFVTFSPDGHWLVTGGTGDYRLWKIPSWEAGPVIPRDRREGVSPPIAFTRDNRVLALARSLQHVQLLDFATCQEIATLSAPDLPCLVWMCFSPDGRLLAVATESHSIQLWDLGAIGRHLRELGLDCDLMPASLPEPAKGATPPARVFQDQFEAEHLRVVAAEDSPHVIQDMKPWGREHWSNGKQLLCRALKGGYVELEVEVPETGRYTVEVFLTRAPHCGQVEVTLDSVRLGPVFDGFHDSVGAPQKVSFGIVQLREGAHRLRFTAVGKNLKSQNYFMGVDLVSLSPVKSLPGTSSGDSGQRR